MHKSVFPVNLLSNYMDMVRAIVTSVAKRNICCASGNLKIKLLNTI
jgi:hypothetical protein